MNEWVELLKSYYSPQEKAQYVELIKKFIKLSRKARAQGLLSLEGEATAADQFLFQKGLELICKGICPDDIRSILKSYIIAKDFSNSELLERNVIIEGMLLLQSGDSGTTILEKLLAMFGEGFFCELEPILWEEEYNFF